MGAVTGVGSAGSSESGRPVHDHVILWRRIDRPGHEAARLSAAGHQWRLSGCAVFAHGGDPCRLAYEVTCDRQWRTLSATILGWVGALGVDVQVTASQDGRWTLNGAARPEVDGCLDIDLNFSPSTNLLPIRRLDLAVGAEAEVKAAWLRFPSFALEPLGQLYRRTSVSTYRYESGGGSFMRDLKVNEAGFVTEYPDLWIAASGR